MLLAIDVGNTHTVFGVWDGKTWVAVWRRATNPDRTEDQIAVWLKGAFDLAGVPYDVDAVVCGSVVPAANEAIERLAQRWFRIDPLFVQAANVGVPVDYEPPSSVGNSSSASATATPSRSTHRRGSDSRSRTRPGWPWSGSTRSSSVRSPPGFSIQ